MEGMTIAQLMQVAAWGLALGTAFFSFFGIRTSKDFFLMTGLIACVLGNFAFAAFLWEQDPGDGVGKGNDTMATMYIMLAFLAMYGVYCQFEMYREEGCGLDDDDDEEDEEEVPAAARADKTINNNHNNKALEDSTTRKRK